MNSLYVVVNGIVMLFIYHPFIFFFSFFFIIISFISAKKKKTKERNGTGTEGKQLYSLRNTF